MDQADYFRVNPENDLFGEPITERAPLANGEAKRKPTRPGGYAAPPGTGPAGQTCRSCKHIARVQHAKTYLKCALVNGRWTNGPGTDILAKSPACRFWEKY